MIRERDRFALAIACTDRGQHEWTALGDLSRAGGLLRANDGYTYGEIARRRLNESVWLDHLDTSKPEYRVHTRCPRCRRHVQWTHVTAVHLMESLRSAGVSQVDISLLP